MKTTLFYFSGTGNTLQIARDLAVELGDTELVSISKVINREIKTDSERIGIIFPVYAFGMPNIVMKFIDKLEKDNHKYYFAVCTHGKMLDGALKRTQKYFELRGIKLSAGFAVPMPRNAIIMFDVFPQEVQQQLFRDAKKKIKAIAPASNDRRESKVDRGSAFHTLVFGIFRPMFVRSMATHDDGLLGR